MATTKSTVKKTAKTKADAKVSASQKISAPKKTTRKKESQEVAVSEVSEAPKSRVITRKYLYAVAGVLVVIGLLFAASRMWVVAWVDNKPLTKFELYSLLEKRDAGKTTEELIVEKLLTSEGQKQKQSVTPAKVDSEVVKIEEQQGGAEQLDQILSIRGLNREDFRKLVELQLLKQKLFGGGIEVTDEDVNKYIEENKASLPPGIMDNPESSEAAQLRESAREQLKQLEINDNFNKWLQEAMNGSRVSRVAPTPTPDVTSQLTPPQQ